MKFILLSSALAAVATAAATDNNNNNTTNKIEWETCPEEYPPELQCGKMQLPIDHDNSTLGNFTLHMVRVPCLAGNDTSACPNSLFFNFGGPGVATIPGFLTDPANGLFGNLREKYALIAPDFRGTGQSNPVRCDGKLMNQRPANDTVEGLAAYNKALGESCLRLTGPLFYHVDAISVVRDLDQMRQALGDDKFNYYGLSYGTVYGPLYAERFPNKVGKIVIDGNIAHSQDDTSLMMTGAATVENSINRFSNWCSTDPECALHGEDAASVLDKVAEAADKKPIPAPGCSKPDGKSCRPNVTADELIFQVKGSFGDGQKGWPDLAEAIKNARDGNATALSLELQEEPVSTDSEVPIACVDGWGEDQRSAERNRDGRLVVARALYPHSRGVHDIYNWQKQCIGWPAPVKYQRRRPNITSSVPPVLIINKLHDASTSSAWAIELRKQIPSAINVFRDSDGHDAINGEEMQQVVEDYYLRKLPKDMQVFST
ncbi:hypothetical protein CP532_1856 [Ophiocordyceps camponoti-leonardi (nom. inval.)]|nr:hypothetical protein CP532_1856 [Ophiocordyceps camponoti-leonardi (nom. inval.)]